MSAEDKRTVSPRGNEDDAAIPVGAGGAGQGRDATACSTFWGFPCPLPNHPWTFSPCRGQCLVLSGGAGSLTLLTDGDSSAAHCTARPQSC